MLCLHCGEVRVKASENLEIRGTCVQVLEMAVLGFLVGRHSFAFLSFVTRPLCLC